MTWLIIIGLVFYACWKLLGVIRESQALDRRYPDKPEDRWKHLKRRPPDE